MGSRVGLGLGIGWGAPAIDHGFHCVRACGSHVDSSGQGNGAAYPEDLAVGKVEMFGELGEQLCG